MRPKNCTSRTVPAALAVASKQRVTCSNRDAEQRPLVIDFREAEFSGGRVVFSLRRVLRQRCQLQQPRLLVILTHIPLDRHAPSRVKPQEGKSIPKHKACQVLSLPVP
jgi:hypothetical protein